MSDRMGRIALAGLGSISRIWRRRCQSASRRRSWRTLLPRVCTGDAGELANVIPHRYVLSTDGRLVHGFDGLGASEREEYYRIQRLLLPTIEDSERCNELSSCGFTVNLPPLHTVQPLLRALPGLAGAQHGAACWDFLSAIGICHASTRAN